MSQRKQRVHVLKRLMPSSSGRFERILFSNEADSHYSELKLSKCISVYYICDVP